MALDLEMLLIIMPNLIKIGSAVLAVGSVTHTLTHTLTHSHTHRHQPHAKL